jgi:hypothetical protein
MPKSAAFSEKARSDIQPPLLTSSSKLLQMLRTWPPEEPDLGAADIIDNAILQALEE